MVSDSMELSVDTTTFNAVDLPVASLPVIITARE